MQYKRGMHEVIPLPPGRAAEYVRHMVAADADSGEGGVYFHPYGKDETVDRAVLLERTAQRWRTPLGEPGWRRAWGWVRDDRIVGHAELVGGHLLSELHRAHLGMGIEKAFRGQGGGRALLTTLVDWARAEPALSWIDLGVFAGNERARSLYCAFGFVEVARTRDRFRVDGVSIEDISMSLALG